MVSKFIPRSQREQQQRRQSFDNECSKLQDINQSNKDFWEQKQAEEEARINRYRRP